MDNMLVIPDSNTNNSVEEVAGHIPEPAAEQLQGVTHSMDWNSRGNRDNRAHPTMDPIRSNPNPARSSIIATPMITTVIPPAMITAVISTSMISTTAAAISIIA
jgi:hypothetical protein